MRPSQVTRASLALTFAGALACAWYAWVTASSAPVSEAQPTREPVALTAAAGRGVFEQRCARCHTFEEAAAPLRAAQFSPQSVLELSAFLVGHAHVDESRARAVVLHLCETTAR